MTAYAAFILAPLPWIALYRLDRRCAEGVGMGREFHTGKVSPANAVPTPSADRRSSRAPDQAATALGQPGPGGPM